MKKRPSTYWEYIKSRGLFKYFIRTSVVVFLGYSFMISLPNYKANEGFHLSQDDLIVIIVISLLYPVGGLAIHKWNHNKYVRSWEDENLPT